MNKRPRSITVISWIFIAVGCIALAYHLQPQHVADLKAHPSLGNDLILVCFVRMLAIVSGVFMLRGSNWARWLLVLWIAFHVILSAFHSLFEVAVHGLLFAIIAYFLFCPRASSYFQARIARPLQTMPPED